MTENEQLKTYAEGLALNGASPEVEAPWGTPDVVLPKARFSSLGRDLYWKHWDKDDGFVRWIGYDDANWWQNVAPLERARTAIGKKTGRRYVIDFSTTIVRTDD